MGRLAPEGPHRPRANLEFGGEGSQVMRPVADEAVCKGISLRRGETSVGIRDFTYRWCIPLFSAGCGHLSDPRHSKGDTPHHIIAKASHLPDRASIPEHEFPDPQPCRERQ